MLLFEDNITKFPYKLLHATRVDIQGSCGGTKLPKMLKSLSEPTICFVDVTPDNSRTLALYEQCVANAKYSHNSSSYTQTSSITSGALRWLRMQSVHFLKKR